MRAGGRNDPIFLVLLTLAYILLRALGYITTLLGSGQSRNWVGIPPPRLLGAERLGHVHTAMLATVLVKKDRGKSCGL